MAAAGSVAAAAAAARKRRILSSNASGTVVTVSQEDFIRALGLEPEPLVVRSGVTHFWSDTVHKYRHLASVKGLSFFCETPEPIELPENVILIDAEKLVVPSDL
ncbi:MAG TPA: hypothetical protein VKB79_17665 [Bryobacteraceae bacterium]|nr:hypothetical protein [Bryobacteraceae bacterium]